MLPSKFNSSNESSNSSNIMNSIINNFSSESSSPDNKNIKGPLDDSKEDLNSKDSEDFKEINNKDELNLNNDGDSNTNSNEEYALSNSISKILNPEENTKIKKYFCPTCNQGFTRKHNMISHELIHSQVKPHICSVCSANFRRIHDLKRHEKLHTGEKPYKCDYCQRSFARPDSLTRHQNSQNACPGLNKMKQAHGAVVLPRQIPQQLPNQLPPSNQLLMSPNNRYLNMSTASSSNPPNSTNYPYEPSGHSTDTYRSDERYSRDNSRRDKFELPPIRNLNNRNPDKRHVTTSDNHNSGYTTTTTTITTTHHNEPGKDENEERMKHDYEHNLAVQRYQEENRRNENDRKRTEGDQAKNLSSNSGSTKSNPQQTSGFEESEHSRPNLYPSGLFNNQNQQFGTYNNQYNNNPYNNSYGGQYQNQYPNQNFNQMQNQNQNQFRNPMPRNVDDRRRAYDYSDDYISLSKYNDLALYTQSLEESLNKINNRIQNLEDENVDNRIDRERLKQIKDERRKRKRKLNIDDSGT